VGGRNPQYHPASPKENPAASCQYISVPFDRSITMTISPGERYWRY